MSVIDEARAWIAQDPDPNTKRELEELIAIMQQTPESVSYSRVQRLRDLRRKVKQDDARS